MNLKLSNLQILIGFAPGPKLLKKSLEFKILTSTYEGSYQLMVNIFASKYVRI